MLLSTNMIDVLPQGAFSKIIWVNISQDIIFQRRDVFKVREFAKTAKTALITRSEHIAWHASPYRHRFPLTNNEMTREEGGVGKNNDSNISTLVMSSAHDTSITTDSEIPQPI